jgi:glycosyltransferase involved in cell wall biosynthesis
MAESMTVIIPTHGRPELLGRTLRTLAACRLPEGFREAVVVENGPRAGAEAVVAAAAAARPALRLRYLHVERANKSHALNAALATVGGGLAVFFDDDVRVGPGALEAYAAAAAGHRGGAFFGGSVEADYEEPPPEWLVPSLPFSARGYDLSAGARPDEFLGFNWAAFVEDLERAGGFDPNYGPGSPTGSSGQETEMQGRLLAQGAARIDAPDAWVWHHVPASRSSPSYAAWWLLRRGVAESQLAISRGESKASLLLKGVLGGARCALVWIKQWARRDDVGRWRAVYGLNRHRGLVRGVLDTYKRSRA